MTLGNGLRLRWRSGSTLAPCLLATIVLCLALSSCQEESDDDGGSDDDGSPQVTDCQDSAAAASLFREVVLADGVDPGVSPAMAVDALGTPAICFVQSPEAGKAVLCTTLAGGAWQTETVDSPSAPPYTLAAALDNGGALHLAYSAVPADGDGVSYNLVHVSNESGQWRTESIDEIGENGIYPVPSVVAAGDQLYVVYSRYEDHSLDTLQVARRVSGGWARETIAGEAILESRPIEAGVATGPDGELAMVYGYPPERDLRVTRGGPGNWRTESIDAEFNGGRPTVQLDGAGRLHAAIWRYNSGTGAVYIREGEDGWTMEKMGTDSKGILGGFGLDECDIPHVAFFSWGDSELFNVDFTIYAMKAGDEWAWQQVDDFGVSALAVRSANDVRMGGNCCVQPNPNPGYDPINGGICYVTSE